MASTRLGLCELTLPSLVTMDLAAAWQARDLALLCWRDVAPRKRLSLVPMSAYQLRSMQPVDMFPHTGHIEIVTVLDRAPA